MKDVYPQPAEPVWATGEGWPEARAKQALEYAKERLNADFDPASNADTTDPLSRSGRTT